MQGQCSLGQGLPPLHEATCGWVFLAVASNLEALGSPRITAATARWWSSCGELRAICPKSEYSEGINVCSVTSLVCRQSCGLSVQRCECNLDRCAAMIVYLSPPRHSGRTRRRVTPETRQGFVNIVVEN